MNPDSLFREVLESHEFRPSDNFGAFICETTHVFEHITFTSDNANLPDIVQNSKAGRFSRYFLD